MKLHKFILPVVASAMLLTGCDEQIMEWRTPDGHGAVTKEEIPLEVKEVLANYDDIKNYVAQYAPHQIFGLGVGAAIYTGDEARQSLANANFQMITLGNAMKMDAFLTNSGSLNTATVDNVLETMPADMRLYGHNFFWYQQQNQTYLKSLIAPTMVVESEGGIANVLQGDASDFNGGTSGGWGSWGSNKESGEVQDGVGVDGTPCMVLANKGDGNNWEAQFAYTFDDYLSQEVTYVMKFKARCSNAAGALQFQYQNGSTYGSQGAYTDFAVGTDWVTCEVEFTVAYEDVNRIIINFGKVGGTYYIDDIEFGEKVEDPMDNVLAGDASDFEGGTTGGWGSWGSNKENGEVVEGAGQNGSYGLVLTNKGDGNFWEAQNAYTFDDYLSQETTYMIQFYAKSSSAAGQLQFQYQNGSTYGSQGAYTTFDVGTDWILCEAEFTPAYEDVNRIIINFGKVGGTYYIDNIKFGPKKEAAANGKRFAPRKATKITYVLKSDQEKYDALTGAMEGWVKAVADYFKEKGVVPAGYDVINEAIADGNGNAVRGLNGVFGGSTTDDDGNTTYDSAPEESTESGLSLNWGNNRWYWGYWVPDYGVKAFQYARKYLPAETKLFINDYNLETSPSKLAALIKWVNEIDAANGAPIVDGIGTQMHVSFRPTDDAAENETKLAELKEKIDAQFQTLAATGKLIRITELDIALGTSTPSAAQYKAQADAYRMIVESYNTIIPQAQQHGITIWSLTDAEDEHEYWLNGEVPNLFDANYLRKWAYKGVCDGYAGEDLGLKYGGSDYKAYYEKQNVSETVK